MNKIYVRVQPKTGQTSFFRCGEQFSQAWRRLEVDDATKQRLEQEQMLEVSEATPAGYKEEAAQAGDSAAGTSTDGGGSGTPADAPPTDPAVRRAAIRWAISSLDKENGALWTGAGKPKTEAIVVVTGWPVTAAERDAALEAAE